VGEWMLTVVFAFLFVEAEKGLGYADERPNFLTRKVILPARFGVAEDRGSFSSRIAINRLASLLASTGLDDNRDFAAYVNEI
jgi:hypothetical protein